MQFKSIARVTAMKASKGTIEETKQSFDSTKVYIETGMSDAIDAFGHATIAYNWGLSDNYHNFVKEYGINKPFDAEITFENITNGGTSKLVLVDLKPVQTDVKSQQIAAKA